MIGTQTVTIFINIKVFQNADTNVCIVIVFLFFKKDFIYLFLHRGEGKEKKRERNINVWLPLACPLLGTWPITQACALIGNRTSDPLVCKLVLNPLSHTSQGKSFNFLTITDHCCDKAREVSHTL